MNDVVDGAVDEVVDERAGTAARATSAGEESQ